MYGSILAFLVFRLVKKCWYVEPTSQRHRLLSTCLFTHSITEPRASEGIFVASSILFQNKKGRLFRGLLLSLSLFQSLSPSLCKHVCECELKRVCLSMQIQVRFNLCGQKSSPQHLKIVWFSRIIEHQRKIKPFSRFRSNKEILFFW